ncbi:LysE family translocator [Micromonospora sp. NPDC049230]|uniref:LysE family translocator n=1 Tax=Micromonospora sp. NPDC049230 TaxID=3155502 RepID=UPI0033E8C3E0
MTIPFLVTTLIVVVTPGTGVFFTLSAGLSRGARAGVLAASACTLGTVPHLLAAMTGLAALLQTSAVAFDIVRYLGVGYLLYLAWSAAFVGDSAVGSTQAMLTCGAVFMLLTFVVFSGYGIFAARLRDRVLTRPRVTDWLRRSVAGTFVALGVTLALTQR